jgi:hypothetical protein
MAIVETDAVAAVRGGGGDSGNLGGSVEQDGGGVADPVRHSYVWFPSLLKSPILTDKGLLPVGKSTLVAKVGVVALVAVVLSRMEAVLLPVFAQLSLVNRRR